MAGYFDKNKDYSLAIKKAQQSGASQTTINQLRQERQNKIDAVYGGKDPYKGTSNIMGNRSDRETISKPGGQLYYGDGTPAVHNAGQSWNPNLDYSAMAEEYAKQGNWDMVDDALQRRQDKMTATGSNGGGRDNIQLWYDLNQKYKGPSAGMTLDQMYAGSNQAYGPGGRGPMAPGVTPQMPEQPQAPGTFEDFMDQMGYDAYADATRQAIEAAVKQAMEGYNAQIAAVNKDADEAARQAYIAKMQSQKNLDQQLAAEGYAGGMADSQRIQSETNYENNLNALEMQRADTINELQRAIENAKLTGDMQTAQELARYLQQLEGQWNGWLQNQQQMQMEQSRWDQQQQFQQQQFEAQQQDQAYNRVMGMLQAGILPSQEQLMAAGINQQMASQILGTVGQPAGNPGNPGKPRKPRGGGYDNKGIDANTVKQMQQALGVTADGMWGAASQAAAKAAGYSGIEEVLAAMQPEKPAGMPAPSYGALTQLLRQLIAAGEMDKANAHIEKYGTLIEQDPAHAKEWTDIINAANGR